MKHTQNILLVTFWSTVAASLLIVALFETDTIVAGCMACDNQTEFIVSTLMELLTLACIPTALRLFKIPKVYNSLRDDYLRWALARMMLLGLPLIANTLLYYIYMTTPFGYLAIIILVSMVFVYPSKARCEAENGEREKEDDKA